MVILCRVLHHRYRNKEDKLMTVEILTALAMVSDKYACSEVLVYQATCWLEMLGKFGCERDAVALLLPAYLFGSAQSFRNVSKNLVWNWTDSVRMLRDQADPAKILLPEVFCTCAPPSPYIRPSKS